MATDSPDSHSAPGPSRLMANLSHEIRTPLNAVVGISNLLANTELTDEQKALVERIQKSGRHLLELINGILDYSSIDAGKFSLRLDDFSLEDCLGEAFDVVAESAFARQLNLACYVAPDIPSSLRGDANRFRQIFVNLLSNAVKFTPQGEVLLTAEFNGRSEGGAIGIQFAVHDTGIGIASDRHEEIFHPFHQLDDSSRRQHQGTGLGLTITRHLVQQMGGDLQVASTPGKGTTFDFTLYLQESDVAPTGTVTSSSAIFPAKVVLVCEPTPGARRLTCRTLSELGLIPHAVGSHSEAYERLHQNASVAAVLLPAGLHDTESNELATEIRTQSQFRGVKLLLLSPPSREHRQTDQLLFDFCLKRPLRRSDLAHTLASMFGKPANKAENEERPASPASVPLQILLAEDDAVNQEVALGYLRQLNHTADTVTNGNEALRRLHDTTYDLVLMDLQMPERDGLDTTREIRRRLPRHRQPWIAAMTANVSPRDRQICVEAGMNDFLPKPISSQEMAAVLEKAQSSRRQRNLPLSMPPSPGDPSLEAFPKENTALRRMKDLAGKLGPEQTKVLVQLYLKDMAALLIRLEEALETGSQEEAIQVAHRIKGASANVGANGVREIASEIEGQLKQDLLKPASAPLIQLRQTLQKWDRAATAWMNET